MLTTKDLMIGDIITFKDSVQADEIPIPVKVVALGYQHHGEENEALVRIGDDETCDVVTIDEEFVGYPLTAEILEKNGFEKDPESGELIWTDDDVTEVVWVGTILTIRGEYANAEFATCMFVHELQHALRLCGIEKELEL